MPAKRETNLPLPKIHSNIICNFQCLYKSIAIGCDDRLTTFIYQELIGRESCVYQFIKYNVNILLT